MILFTATAPTALLLANTVVVAPPRPLWLPALMLTLLVLLVIRLAALPGYELARRIGPDKVFFAGAVCWLTALCTCLVLRFELPRLASPQGTAVPGSAATALLAAALATLITTPLAWRWVLRRRRAATGEQGTRVFARAGSVAWLCVLSLLLLCVTGWQMNQRVLIPSWLAPALTPLRMCFTVAFLLTVVPTWRWLRRTLTSPGPNFP